MLKSDSVFDVSTASLPELLAGFGMGHQVDFLKLDAWQGGEENGKPM